jgi:membrane fusion protein, multidrug efflux system
MQMERDMYRERDDETGISIQLPQVIETRNDSRLASKEANALEIAKQGAETLPPPRPNRRRLALMGVAAAVVIVAGAWYGTQWWTTGRFVISTDDAYVRSYNTTLASKVAGYLVSIPVQDNVEVRAGDVIATVDDGDYRLAVDAARDKVATQQATVARFTSQIAAQQANVEQSRAQLVSAQAAAKKMQLEFDRQQALLARSYASRQTLEQAEANRDQAVAAVQSGQSVLDGAEANVDVLKAQQHEAERTLDELRTALAKAERDLSFTVIRAPVNGVFGNRAVQTGDYMQTGQRIASLVPLDEVYVEANFKETQLARLHPGQPVSIAVDALPDHAIKGKVSSLAPASGAVFSLLPPDNATGNFTKIVQRLPVRIEVPADVTTQRLLRTGMSVVVSVDTKPETTAGRGAIGVAQAAQAAPAGQLRATEK